MLAWRLSGRPCKVATAWTEDAAHGGDRHCSCFCTKGRASPTPSLTSPRSPSPFVAARRASWNLVIMGGEGRVCSEEGVVAVDTDCGVVEPDPSAPASTLSVVAAHGQSSRCVPALVPAAAHCHCSGGTAEEGILDHPFPSLTDAEQCLCLDAHQSPAARYLMEECCDGAVLQPASLEPRDGTVAAAAAAATPGWLSGIVRGGNWEATDALLPLRLLLLPSRCAAADACGAQTNAPASAKRLLAQRSCRRLTCPEHVK